MTLIKVMSEETSKFLKIRCTLHLILPMIRKEGSADESENDGHSVGHPWNPDQESFDNLSNLMEYNVLNNAKVVRDEISQGKNLKKYQPEVHSERHLVKNSIKAIKLRRRYRSRCTITKGDILGSSMKEQHKQELISSLARENLFEIS